MKHLTAILLLSMAAATGFAQSPESEAQQDPPPSQGPTIERSRSGVTVIRGSSGATQAARAQAAKEAEDAKKAADQSQEAAAETKTQQQNTAPPKARNIVSYRYGPNGERTRVTTSEQNTESGGQSTQTIVGTGGEQVPYISTQEKVITNTADQKVVERRVQRYNPQGNPAREAVVREEERKLPDGTIEKVTTVYEEDLNGNLQPAERTVAREITTGSRTRTVTTNERPSASGGFETVSQTESIETKQGEESAIVETVVKRPSINGRLSESKRERTVVEKSGSTATTETEVWERSTASGDVTLSQRKVGTVTERPDGSTTETIKIYGASRSGGGASDANATSGLRLNQTVQREKTIGPDGQETETTTTQSRTVADPSQMGERQVVRKTTRPTSDGATIETTTSEQGVNRNLNTTQTTVEQVKK